ncbi:MAG: prepilin-type N-terminal cleavage/methylation domain-containing protein [Candidatus Saccharimonas aalborgensis]
MIERGYTVVEVVVVVTIVTILAAIAIAADPLLLNRSRDIERQNDIASIGRAFEDYYRLNASTSGPGYPTTSDISSSLDSIAATYGKDIFIAPKQSSYSLVNASSTSPATATQNTYIYQPFTATGTLCSTAPCVRYRLYYYSEATGSTMVRESMRQQ